MKPAVYTAAAFALLVLGGLLWVELSLRREIRAMDRWWARGGR